jgi:magnesium transporter
MRKIRKPAIGARPGTLVIDPGAAKSVMRAFVYDENTLEEHELHSIDDVKKLQGSGRNLWIDVQSLGDEGLLRGLAELFSIHALALEDVVNVPIRPKAESYEQHLLVVGRMLSSGPADRLDVEQVSMFIGRDYVLTFQEKHGDVLDPVRERLRLEGSRTRTKSADYLGYAILDTIIDAYYPVVESMGDRIEQMEELVLTNASPETLRKLNAIKGQLLVLRRAITPQREAVNAMIRDENELISQNVRVYLRDTYDHIVQTSEAVEVSRELINGLMNTYLSVVSNRMNEVMKVLTIVASIFVPLTFMAGIYGMNFEYMPELGVRAGYPILMGAMAIVAFGMVVFFWLKGWIGGRPPS